MSETGRVFAVANVKLNVEQANTPTTTAPFCGLILNCSSKSLALAPKFMTKLKHALDAFDPDRARIDDFESLASRLAYALYATGRALSKGYFFVKFLRRILNKVTRGLVATDATISLPPVVRADMAHLVRCVADNVPQRVDEHPPDFSTGHEDVDAILDTDATPEGYGGVLLIPGATTNGHRRSLAHTARQHQPGRSSRCLANTSRFPRPPAGSPRARPRGQHIGFGPPSGRFARLAFRTRTTVRGRLGESSCTRPSTGIQSAGDSTRAPG
jgi:hypothetical protein